MSAARAFRLLTNALPPPLKEAIRPVYRKAVHYGRTRFCPICRSHVRGFLPAGVVPRPDAMCPVCESYERHRLLWVFFQKHTDLFAGRFMRLLHVAPEPILASRLRRLRGVDYLSADLRNPEAMVEIDITDIPYSDESFDVILCSHVLEHVPDDRTGMSELLRVLSRGGWAVLQVPTKGDKTIEDPSITDPADREKLFGQHDHVRYYGADFNERLVEAGFQVRCFTGAEVAGPQNVARMGILADEIVYFCTR
ncbi:MAG TPA: class I SAM-dependent methyltransferase [Candidatus Polarisedimenticolia bacterium]|nr:class I SAM-dependent methyltransferase [Candidatus Polarisedimenticolia bacterium]